MKGLRWQFIVVALACVGIFLLLVSQKDNSQPGSKAVEQPAIGGEYTEALIGEFGRLNPLFDFYNSPDYDIDRLLFSSLIQFDSRGLPHGELAETWGISKDGKTYSFSIRQNAIWHDGEPVTSDDVIFTIELLRDEELPIPNDIRSFWKQIQATSIDEKTLQFRLPAAFSPFLDYLTFGVLPEHILGGLSPEEITTSTFNVHPIGCGPYQFDSLITSENKVNGVKLRSFDRYFLAKPFIPKVTFLYYPNGASALEAYRKNEVMGISQVAPELLSQVLAEPNLNVFTGRIPQITLIYLNLNDPKLPFFQDAAVRKALLMGINRQWIIDHILNGQAILAHGPIFPESWAYYEGIQQTEFDPDKAISILRKAGYTYPAEGGNVRSKDGIPLSFEMAYPEGEIFTQIANQIAADWKRLGVEIRLVPVSHNDLMKKYLEPRQYQSALVSINLSRSPDPDPYPFWHQAQIKNGQNYPQWDDRQVSEYLEQARVLVDISERIKRYYNFQVRFGSELPALPLYYPVYSYAVDKKVHGVSMGPIYDPSDRFAYITSWYLITKEAIQSSPTP